MDGLATSDATPALADHAAEVVARRLAAGGEPTRPRLVMELRARGDATVQELATAVGGSLPNVSKHLQVLYQCGIVRRHKEGTYVRYEIATHALGVLLAYAVQILGGGTRPNGEPRRFPRDRPSHVHAHGE